jgi:hypothetical protein
MEDVLSEFSVPQLPPGAPTLAKRLRDLLVSVVDEAATDDVRAAAINGAVDALTALPQPASHVEIINGTTHWRDAEGRLCPEGLIKPIDQLKEEFVRAVAYGATALSASLARFKEMTLVEAAALREVVAADYKIDLGGQKGNLSVTSYDGSLRVEVSVQSRIEMKPENMAAALASLRTWLEKVDADPGIRQMIDVAFGTGSENGSIRVAEILKLRNLNIDHPDWRNAMEAIVGGIRVSGTKEYVRVRRRSGDDMALIPLDLAAV